MWQHRLFDVRSCLIKIYKVFKSKKNSFYVLLSQVCISASNFLSTLILARVLGLDDFGVFSVYWMVMLFVGSVFMALIIFPLMSVYPALDMEREQYIHGLNWLLFYFLVVFTFFSLLFFYMFGFSDGSKFNYEFIFCFLIFVCGTHYQDYVRRLLFVFEQPLIVFFIDIASLSLRMLLLMALYYYSALDVLSGMLALGLSCLIPALFCYRVASCSLAKINCARFSFSKNYNLAKWLLPSGLMQWTSINFYIVVAGAMLGPAAVGVIRACQSILAISNILIQTAENIIPVKASSIFKDAGMRSLSLYFYKVCIFGSIPFIFLILMALLYGGSLLGYLYGDEYREYSEVLFVYSFSFLLMYLIVPARAMLRTLDRARVWFSAYLISSIIAVASFYFIVDSYQEIGVAAGIFVSNFVLLFVAFLNIRGFVRAKVNG